MDGRPRCARVETPRCKARGFAVQYQEGQHRYVDPSARGTIPRPIMQIVSRKKKATRRRWTAGREGQEGGGRGGGRRSITGGKAVLTASPRTCVTSRAALQQCMCTRCTCSLRMHFGARARTRARCAAAAYPQPACRCDPFNARTRDIEQRLDESGIDSRRLFTLDHVSPLSRLGRNIHRDDPLLPYPSSPFPFPLKITRRSPSFSSENFFWVDSDTSLLLGTAVHI